MNEEWHFLWINPEPWTSPSVAVGRGKGGKPFPQVYKSAGLTAYQNAVKELLEGRNMLIFDPGTPIALEFYFWRRLPDYKTDSERRSRKHEADATNMQKALEDALQGILFENDRDVKNIRSVIMEQGHDTEPCIGIKISFAPPPPDIERPLPDTSRPVIDLSPGAFIENVEDIF